MMEQPTAMHVARIKSSHTDKQGRRREYESRLLRRTYREDGKVRHETLANLSKLPDHMVDTVEAALRGEVLAPAQGTPAVTVTRSLPHGHVAAAMAMAAKLGMPRLLGPAGPQRDLALALIISRVTHPGSKLSTLGWWADTTLGPDLGIDDAATDDVYAAMDWLQARQDTIEKSLARRHLAPAVNPSRMALFDLSSSWPQIRTLMADDGPLQLSLFDEQDLAEITSPGFPGERLIACRNPALADERARKREALLTATEKLLAPVITRVAAGRLPGADKIGTAVGKVIGKYKMAKHLDVTITDDSLAVERKQDQIDDEARLDGIYIIRTPVPAETLATAEAVTAYKNLKYVERDFRHIKSDDLDLRPVFHRLEKRVKGHVLICMLAAYLTWHLRQAWAPLTYTDQDPPVQANPVTPARRPASAEVKASRQHDADGRPYRSFGGLLAHLGTLTATSSSSPARPPKSPSSPSRPASSARPSTSSASRSRSPCGSSQDRHRQEQRNSRPAAVSVSEAAVTSD
jgi:hypothetical protein